MFRDCIVHQIEAHGSSTLLYYWEFSCFPSFADVSNSTVIFEQELFALM